MTRGTGPGPGDAAGRARLLDWIEQPWAPWAVLAGLVLLRALFGLGETFLGRTGAPPGDRWLMILSVAGVAVAWMILAPQVPRTLARFPLDRRSWRRSLPRHLLAALVVGATSIFLLQVLAEPLRVPRRSLEAACRGLLRSLRYNAHDAVLTYAFLTAAAMAFERFRSLRRKALDASRLERDVADARLESLRAQLHPHFVFNTLNSVLPLIFTQPAAAAETVIRLGCLLRLSLRFGAASRVSLGEESEFLSAYLEIERTRLGDRLSVDLSFDPATLDASIPSLVVKPFVDEALRTGVMRRPGPGRVTVHASRDRDEVVLEVRSEGQSDGPPDEEPGEGDELRAARERLLSAFEGRSRADVAIRPDGCFAAVLAFPHVPHARRAAASGPVPASDAPRRARRSADPVSVDPAPAARDRAALAVAGTWLAIGLFTGTQLQLRDSMISWGSGHPRPGLAETYLVPLADSAAWALLTPLVVFVTRRFRLRGRTALAAIPVLTLTGLLCSTAAPLAADATRAALLGKALAPSAAAWIGGPLRVEIWSEALTYVWVVLAVVALDMARRARQQELETERLSAQLTRARLSALENQLQPHFLFNTLNTLLPLIHSEPEAAARTLVQLGDLLRTSLRRDASQLVPLREELDFLARYLEIERTRFRDRLVVGFAVDEAALGGAVPNLLLQPLVENAVKHGISRQPGPGRIDVAGTREGGILRLKVRNSCPVEDGLPPTELSGIGLANTRERLLHHYGDGALLEAGPDGRDGFLVTLRLPWSVARAPEAEPGYRSVDAAVPGAA